VASLLFMNFLDVARSLGQDPLNARPERVRDFVKREFRRSGGTFNYNPSIVSLGDIFRDKCTVEEAEEYCATHGSPAGRVPNIEAIRIAGSYAAEHKSNCYKIPFTAVPIGRLSADRIAYMAVKAPLVRVENDHIFVVVPGFRLGHRPEDIEIDVAASFALANFARDDFSEADFEYLDCSRGISGERELQVIHGKNRKIFNIDEVDEMLQIFVRGLDMAINEGMTAQKPNFRGYHVIDPDQPRMV
jgi:hypothetical protein